MIQQSDAIFAALIIAFLLFITSRGELPTYIGFILKGGTTGSGSKASAPGSGSTASAPSSLGGVVGNAAASPIVGTPDSGSLMGNFLNSMGIGY